MKHKLIYGLALVTLFSSCTKNFDEMNTDTKRPTEVPAQTLFAQAAHSLNRQVATLNVNNNNTKLWSQYLTQTTYIDESNYDLTARNVPEQEWREMYRDVLQDLAAATSATNKESYSLAVDKTAQQNRLAIIEILNVYTYERLTNIFGDVPYSEALTESNLPKFDDAETIYLDLLVRLDAAIGNLDASTGSFSGGYDNLFEGDVAMWKQFAYGLKMKMGITMADANPTASSAAILDAWDKVFSSSSEGAYFGFLSGSPNTNPIYEDLVLSGRADFVAANTIVDMMNTLNDPRIGLFFTMAPDTTVYIGGTYGASNSYGLNSHAGANLHTAELANTLMDYSEMEFYKAEAIERGIAGSGTAEQHYNNAITASFDTWGAADVATYLAQADVAYSTAAGDWKQKIGTQAWLAYFNRGVMGWTTFRRLDQPTLNQAAGTTDPTPVRYTYPVNEQTLNGTNYSAAASAIGGDTKNTTLVG